MHMLCMHISMSITRDFVPSRVHQFVMRLVELSGGGQSVYVSSGAMLILYVHVYQSMTSLVHVSHVS